MDSADFLMYLKSSLLIQTVGYIVSATAVKGCFASRIHSALPPTTRYRSIGGRGLELTSNLSTKTVVGISIKSGADVFPRSGLLILSIISLRSSLHSC